MEERSGELVECSKCGKPFIVLSSEDDALRAAKRTGRKRFLVRCLFCKQMTDALRRRSRKKKRKKGEDRRLFRCPEPCCSGWVCWVHSHWGCGECGEAYDEPELFAAIDWAVAHLRYRRFAWRKTKRGWLPSARGNDAKYDEKVGAERWPTRAQTKARSVAIRKAVLARR